MMLYSVCGFEYMVVVYEYILSHKPQPPVEVTRPVTMCRPQFQISITYSPAVCHDSQRTAPVYHIQNIQTSRKP
jgi:hypothetical protein